MKEVNPCRGCVCDSCCKSEQNGNSYGCPRKRCSGCQENDRIDKLGYCEDGVAVNEKGETFTL